MTMAAWPIDWSNAARAAPEFISTIVVIALRLPPAQSPQYRLTLTAAWIGALTDLALGVSRAIESGQWHWLLHPLHMLGAGLWMGTLSVLVIASGWRPRNVGYDDRLVARTFARFAYVAGGSALGLAVTGVASAARRLSLDGRSPAATYTVVLAVKLALVLCVSACGAWNWRALRSAAGRTAGWPTRVAIAEVGAATLVVVAAAVLMSVQRAR